ncbi:Omp28-related outer membrane protein [Nonlabens sp. SY33080]|uniref:Omp28-related outer membrane protein n=1 Tax=Nonlabens sp. SY33080 TaxID=2719911 RepID=UPI001428A14B|nr:Omp28-related outer membrane protein [Nonlabens sp. SY33080]
MKTANFLKIFLLLVAVTLTSCSSESTDDGGGNGNGNGELVLSANKTRVYENTVVTFTVMNGSTNVTSQSTISLDGTPISGNSALLSTVGSKVVTAEYDGASTNNVDVEVIVPSYSTKMLIEDYTGAWCGWCPRISQGIEDLTGSNPNVIAVAIHNGDSMAFPLEGQMRQQFGVNGFPTGILNRDQTWSSTSGSSMNLTQPNVYLNRVQPVGLAINSSISNDLLSATVKVGFDLDESGLYLVVYALENGIIANQSNYTNNYGGVDPIQGFVHEHVLSKNLTDVFGDPIPADQQVGGNEYSVTLTSNVAGVANQNDMEIVAFVVDASGKVVNVQKAQVGTNVDFD